MDTVVIYDPAPGPAAPAGLSVLEGPTFRITSSTDNVTAYSSSTFTAPSGTNRLMLIGTGSWFPGTSADTTVSSVTFGAQGATEAADRNVTPADIGNAIYYILDADIPSGAQTLTINTTNNARSCTAVVMFFEGVDQTTPLPTIGTMQGGTSFGGSGPHAINLTTANNGSYMVSHFVHQSGEASPTLACSEVATEVVAATGTGGTTDNTGGMAYEEITTAGAEAHTWSSSIINSDWAGVAVEVKAA